MIEHRKRFPFEISGLADQRGLTGMEAVYENSRMGKDGEEAGDDWMVPQYHPNVPPCFKRRGGEAQNSEFEGGKISGGQLYRSQEEPGGGSLRKRPCRCQENGLGVVMPDQETQYFMNMYPEKMSRVQRKVEEECDKMDYAGSIMYDEFPDRVLLKRISRNIYEILLEDDLLAEGEVIDGEAWDVEEESEAPLTETGLFSPNPSGRPPMGMGMGPGQPGGPGRPPMGPGQPGGPWGPPMGPGGPGRPPWRPGCPSGRCSGKDSWLQEAVDILLFEEMQRRRRNRFR